MTDLNKEPSVRVRATNDLLSHLDDFRSGLQAEVRSRIPAATLALLDRATTVDWTSIEHTHFVIDAIVDTVGREQAPEVWASFVQEKLLKSKLIKVFVDAGIRLFGASPTSVIKMTPRAWHAAYRNFCDPRVFELESERTIIALDNIAPKLLAYPNYFVAFEGVFTGLVRAFGATEIKVSITIDSDKRSGLVSMQWRYTKK